MRARGKKPPWSSVWFTLFMIPNILLNGQCRISAAEWGSHTSSGSNTCLTLANSKGSRNHNVAYGIRVSIKHEKSQNSEHACGREISTGQKQACYSCLMRPSHLPRHTRCRLGILRRKKRRGWKDIAPAHNQAITTLPLHGPLFQVVISG